MGDLLSQFTAAQEMNKRMQQAYDMMLNTAQTNLTPGAAASGIQAMTQPLSAATTRNTLNKVQAAEAEAGRTQSPGLYAYDVAQALGPQNLQQQQLGQQAYFNTQGFPFQLPISYPTGGGAGGFGDLTQGIGNLFGNLFGP